MMSELKYKPANLFIPVLLFIVNHKKGLRQHLAALGEHTIAIRLKRIDRPFILKISDGCLRQSEDGEEPEVVFKSDILTFFRIAFGVIDADSAFFERKMAIEGSTPLSLLLKNALDRFSR